VKVIILAGGFGTRISEETSDKPKPMVLINGKPILWHLMNIFAAQGFTEFVVACGYKGEVIADWTEDMSNRVPWKITALDTGLDSQTGGRIKRCMEFIGHERVLATYGDGLANVDLNKLINIHELNKNMATLTAVRPPARFGHLELSGEKVLHFGEKNQSDAGWINGGFFLLEPEVLKFIQDYNEPFETGALPKLTEIRQLNAYQHFGFWQPMDTLREKLDLERFAKLETPPWMQNIDNS
jgi:glucose-1-phosphate cytidylyltransferase